LFELFNKYIPITLEIPRNMENYFPANLLFLRKQFELNQTQFADFLGKKKSIIGPYEKGEVEPDISTLLKISEYFGISISDLIGTDLSKGMHKKKASNAYLNANPNAYPTVNEPSESYTKKVGTTKTAVQGNVQPRVQPSVEEPSESYTKSLYIGKNSESKSGRSESGNPLVREHFIDTSGLSIVPVVDIRAAAGDGYLNAEYLDENQVIRMPAAMMKKGHNLCIRVKGNSMAPTILDGGMLVVHLLEQSEWAGMRDGYVHVIVDQEGHTLVKRVKNRLNASNGGFIVCMSDNPDKMAHPNFNLTPNEIQHIWEVTWYMTAKIPNVQETFDTRLADLEDGQEELKATVQTLLKRLSK
jgi:phage repressor protein C with HTH and peptisase S24 domain/transcriptional regulator with XRE-family HTH domain